MTENKIPYKIYLEESEMPQAWYNVRADMPIKPAPLLNPATGEPCTAEDLGHVFCDELVKQELDDTTRYIPDSAGDTRLLQDVPPEPAGARVLPRGEARHPGEDILQVRGQQHLGLPQAQQRDCPGLLREEPGPPRRHHRDGAGQWGTALAMACGYLGLDCKVYMVKCSYEQKPFRREVMRTYGASVTPSPSPTTEVGRKILAENPDTTGSLGCAISEAVEAATTNEGYRYVLGSVLNQVLLHQSVIGMETKIALDKYGVVPDMIIGCAGGGSNLGGLISPLHGREAPRRAGL